MALYTQRNEACGARNHQCRKLVPDQARRDEIQAERIGIKHRENTKGNRGRLGEEESLQGA